MYIVVAVDLILNKLLYRDFDTVVFFLSFHLIIDLLFVIQKILKFLLFVIGIYADSFIVSLVHINIFYII